MEKVIYTTLNEAELERVFSNVIRKSQLLSISIDESEDEELNQKEAARFLGISQTTIIKWKKAGKIPYDQVPGSSKIRFYKSQLRKAVRRNPHLLQAARN